MRSEQEAIDRALTMMKARAKPFGPICGVRRVSFASLPTPLNRHPDCWIVEFDRVLPPGVTMDPGSILVEVRDDDIDPFIVVGM